MQLKKNVKLENAVIEIRPVLQHAERVWKKHGQELVITSYRDGIHSASSLHYYGLAIDLRTRYFRSKQQVTLVARELQSALGRHFLVIVEHDHIHVQVVLE